MSVRVLAMLLSLAAGWVPLAFAQNSETNADSYLDEIKPLLARRCVACHGAERPRAGLRLDTAAGAIRGGTSGPAIIPGDPESSELLLAVLGEGVGERMPLKRPPLAASEIEAIRRWIAQGAVAPADETPSDSLDTHWAFVPPVHAVPPRVERSELVRNPIDAFLQSALEREGIEPNHEADPTTLIRRASLDLIGLPPTIEEIETFLEDARPDAYERLIDRLLASPHYGERWARWWLDMARYSDSNGYSIDAPREIWAYRNWVIGAFNDAMPFDEFTVDQLAGDLQPNSNLNQKIATGFHRNTPINMEGGIDQEQFRVESVIDRVNTTGTVWLGLTIGCAQCHDHKYDPISQNDYYQLFAFFNNSDEPTLSVATPEKVAQQREIAARIDGYRSKIAGDPALRLLQKAWEEGMTPAQRQGQSEEVRKALDVALERREETANQPAFAAFLDQSQASELQEHQRALAELRQQEPRIVTTLVISERGEPRPTHVLLGGDFTRPGEIVEPDVPGVLPSLGAMVDHSPNRLDLARWLVDRGNPLTARVLVNRLWETAFGHGLVSTDADFGTQGAPPSHPELLDWLAVEIVDRGWSIKEIQRLMMTSSAYRRSTQVLTAESRDPENRWLGRQTRLRLDAELVRDAALVASGRLVRRIGGPSVFPPQPDGVMNLGQVAREWKADIGPNRYRRALYTHHWRATPHPLLTVFDAPDAARACTRRPRSNTPLQALMMLNDEAFLECADALAGQISERFRQDDADGIEWAFQMALGRKPTDIESSRLLDLLRSERESLGDAQGWRSVARVLMNLDEFITRE